MSLASEMRQKLNIVHARCILLEDHAIVQYSWLMNNTTIPEMLEVTENRQFKERGLLHISDAAYSFVLLLETKRVQLFNTQRIKQCAAKSEFVDTALKGVLASEDADPNMKVLSGLCSL